jgi:hypothetical protein
MTTLTSSAEFTVLDASTEATSVTLTVLPIAEAGEGSGRLIHPSLGTYDYPQGPDEWTNMDGDAVIAPVWSSTLTLAGAANTLWQGTLQDVVIEERWLGRGGLSMPIDQLRMLLSMWMNPPDPASGYVQWAPGYANSHTYKVILLNILVAGQPGSTLTSLNKAGWPHLSPCRCGS